MAPIFQWFQDHSSLSKRRLIHRTHAFGQIDFCNTRALVKLYPPRYLCNVQMISCLSAFYRDFTLCSNTEWLCLVIIARNLSKESRIIHTCHQADYFSIIFTRSPSNTFVRDQLLFSASMHKLYTMMSRHLLIRPHQTYKMTITLSMFNLKLKIYIFQNFLHQRWYSLQVSETLRRSF